MTECMMRTAAVCTTKDNDKKGAGSARSYLESYLIYSKMLDMRVCEEGLSSSEDEEKRRAAAAYEIVCIKTRMREIEEFIEKLKIDGKWIEECSEKMYVSRSTAYRLKKRALKIAAEQFSA